MKFRRIASLLLLVVLLAGCGRGAAQEDLTGCWLMGQDREYRYLSRFHADGTMELVFVPQGDWAEVFTVQGSYRLENGTLIREYVREIPENSALGLPAALEIRNGGLILDYGDFAESWARLTPAAESLCLSREPGVECADCGGLGIRGIRDDLPLWCETCCGLGYAAE